ncbi:MAG TPA: DUF222 domain-containing protein [Kofleriaceae bacterium]
MENELEQLGERIAEQAAHLDAATHRLLADLRAFDTRGGWHVQGAASCAHWLAWRVGWDLVTARDHVRVARKLAGFAAIDDALRCGEVSYSKVRAMLRVATSDNEVMLLEHAKLMTASQLEKLCRKYALVLRHSQDPHPQGDEQRRYVRRRDTEDGMVKIEAVLHPEEAEVVWAMLDHAAAQLARERDHQPALPGRDSAESGAALRPHANLTGPVSAPATRDGLEDEACVIGDGLPRPPNTSSTDDSAESFEAASPVARWDAGLDDAASAERCAVGLGGGASGAVHAVVSVGVVEDPDAVAASVASSQPFSDAGPRSGLDRLLDEVEAFRGADELAHDAFSDLCDAECELGAAEAGQRSSEAISGRREASSLRDRAAAARKAFNRAVALVAMAQGYLRGDRPERAPIEVVLTTPASSLRAGATLDPVEVGEMGESFLSSETARRLSCDAGVVDVVEDEHGTPLSVGRRRRTISGALKRALHKRDGMCGYPGCTNRLFLEGHHIQHWADGGETSLSNAVLLCSFHHRYVHEYGYSIELGPDQRPRFRDPHGRWVPAVPELPCVAELGWPQIRAANAALQVDADTIAGPWDGTPVDYGRIVGHLCAVDGLA